VADKSSIEWTDATWNPATGCTKVSPGCDHCYAERIVERFKGKGAFEHGRHPQLHPERLDAAAALAEAAPGVRQLDVRPVPRQGPGRVHRPRVRRHGAAPRHTFQVLTKRHARMRSLLRSAASGRPS
jgi:protein gp37